MLKALKRSHDSETFFLIEPSCIKRTTRRYPQSGLNGFGLWSSRNEWFSGLAPDEGPSLETSIFSCIVSGSERTFTFRVLLNTLPTLVLDLVHHPMRWCYPLLNNDLNAAIDNFFPVKTIRFHPTDKPWITGHIKQLIKERQRAFHTGDTHLWRQYRRMVQLEIKIN